ADRPSDPDRRRGAARPGSWCDGRDPTLPDPIASAAGARHGPTWSARLRSAESEHEPERPGRSAVPLDLHRFGSPSPLTRVELGDTPLNLPVHPLVAMATTHPSIDRSSNPLVAKIETGG